MDLEHIRSEIEYMRKQVSRQRKDILSLQRAGIDVSLAEGLLARMQDRVDRLCLDRDRLAGEERLRLGRIVKGTPAARRA